MYWVIQANMYNEEGFASLISALERMEIKHSVHKVVPFVGQLDPPVDPPTNNVIVMGTYTLSRIAHERGWSPGSFLNENFHILPQLEHWGSNMLNDDARICRFADVDTKRLPLDLFFIKPTTDSKEFAGAVMDAVRFEEWRKRVLDIRPEAGATLTADTEILIASLKDIDAEYRLWIVDGRVVTASRYKLGSMRAYNAMVDARIMVFGQRLAQTWSPARAYCMDVFDTPKGLFVGEINNLNSAGFYKANMNRLVGVLENTFTSES